MVTCRSVNNVLISLHKNMRFSNSAADQPSRGAMSWRVGEKVERIKVAYRWVSDSTNTCTMYESPPV